MDLLIGALRVSSLQAVLCAGKPGSTSGQHVKTVAQAIAATVKRMLGRYEFPKNLAEPAVIQSRFPFPTSAERRGAYWHAVEMRPMRGRILW